MAKMTLNFDQRLDVLNLLKASFLDDNNVTTLRRDDLCKELARRLKLRISTSTVDSLLKTAKGTYLNTKPKGVRYGRPYAVIARAVKHLYEKAGESIPDELANLIENPPATDGEDQTEPEAVGAANSNGSIFNG